VSYRVSLGPSVIAGDLIVAQRQTYPHPRRAVGQQVDLAKPSGFPLNPFGAIMLDDHQVPPIDFAVHPFVLRQSAPRRPAGKLIGSRATHGPSACSASVDLRNHRRHWVTR
jgi:hypothetical protein